MEHIPEHILVTIFKYLNADDLDSASRVDKRWKNVINSCSVLMSRLKLDFIIQQATSLDDAYEESKRLRHSHMIIRSTFGDISRDISRATKSRFLNIINNSQITTLALISLPFNFELSILSSLSNITTLYINSQPLSDKHFPIIEFPNLTRVDVPFSPELLKCIGRNRIEKLRLPFISRELFEFFERCHYLKDLTISGFYLSGHDRGFTNFQLEKLSFKVFDYVDYVDVLDWKLENGQHFLKSQRHSLKELKIDYSEEMQGDEIIEYAFNNMNLITLHAHQTIENGHFYRLNENMKNLLLYSVNNSIITENIIICCPMVEKIYIDRMESTPENLLPLLSKHMSNLRFLHLTIDPLSKSTLNANFQLLDTLSINYWNGMAYDQLKCLANCCPNLKNLDVIIVNPSYHQHPSDPADPSLLEEFFKSIPNVETICTNSDFGMLTNNFAKRLVELSSHLKLQYLKIKTQYPENFESIVRIFHGTKIKLSVIRY